jgi:hypothetical protein
MPVTLAERQAAYALLVNAPTDARMIRDRATAARDDVDKDNRWGPEYRAELLATIEREHLDAVNALRVQVQAAAETLTNGARELDQPPADPTAQLAAATLQGQAWARQRPQLDAGRHWSHLLADAAAAGDRAAVLALAAEVPNYLVTKKLEADPSRAARAQSEHLDVTPVRQAMDVAVARVLGDDKGPGTAAAARVHVQRYAPLASAELDAAEATSRGRRGGLGGAMALRMAQVQADHIGAQLVGTAPIGPGLPAADGAAPAA